MPKIYPIVLNMFFIFGTPLAFTIVNFENNLVKRC